jgi:NADH-quinone oxidoreductase subunit C
MAIDHPAIPRLKARFPQLPLKGAQFKGDTQVVIPKDSLLDVVTFLKTDPLLNYNFLSDISAVDYLNFPGAPKDGRFGLVYILSSIPDKPADNPGGPRLILRTFLSEPTLEIESLVPLYAGAEWMEREVFDMFGIKFLHHPDLRRILTWDAFQSFPLRKDYPVTGKGEREQYPVLTRQSS